MCPKCSAWAPVNTHWDFWTCDECYEAMDEWWLVDSLFWHDDTHTYIDTSIDYLYTRHYPEAITADDCMICDSNFMIQNCSCGTNPYDWTDFLRITRAKNINNSDIYALDFEKSMDCYLCEYFNTYQCVPIRNWFRNLVETHTLPQEKISFCKYFTPDPSADDVLIETVLNQLGKEEILLKGI